MAGIGRFYFILFEDDNGGDAEKEEEEDLTDIEFDDEPLEEIYDIF